MFIKRTRSKSRTYAQLVQSFRDEQGQPRQRTVWALLAHGREYQPGYGVACAA
jgi:hypothetical protein